MARWQPIWWDPEAKHRRQRQIRSIFRITIDVNHRPIFCGAVLISAKTGAIHRDYFLSFF